MVRAEGLGCRIWGLDFSGFGLERLGFPEGSIIYRYGGLLP